MCPKTGTTTGMKKLGDFADDIHRFERLNYWIANIEDDGCCQSILESSFLLDHELLAHELLSGIIFAKFRGKEYLKLFWNWKRIDLEKFECFLGLFIKMVCNYIRSHDIFISKLSLFVILCDLNMNGYISTQKIEELFHDFNKGSEVFLYFNMNFGEKHFDHSVSSEKEIFIKNLNRNDHLISMIINDKIDDIRSTINSDLANAQYLCFCTPNDAFRYYPSLFMVSALFGSEACFSYMVDTFNISNFTDIEGHSLLYYAIAGQNHRIIQKCTRFFSSWKEIFESMFSYRVFHLYDWLVSIFGVPSNDDFIFAIDSICYKGLWSGLSYIIKMNEHISSFSSISIVKGNHLYLLDIMLQIDPSIVMNRENNTQKTPLHIACENNYLGCVTKLINSQLVKLNLFDKFMRTPLSYAIENNNIEAVRLLLRTEKVDVNEKYVFLVLMIHLLSLQLRTTFLIL